MITKQDMMDAVIKRFGHESEVAIWFCTMAEQPTITSDNAFLQLTFKVTMEQ